MNERSTRLRLRIDCKDDLSARDKSHVSIMHLPRQSLGSSVKYPLSSSETEILSSLIHWGQHDTKTIVCQKRTSHRSRVRLSTGRKDENRPFRSVLNIAGARSYDILYLNMVPAR